jgi:putative ABC transport system substrate-binding protein
MKRRSGLVAAVASLATPWPIRTRAHAGARRVGYLGYTAINTSDDERSLAAFHQRLLEHGLVVGSNLLIEWRYAEGRLERYDEFAAEFVRQGIELVVVGSGAAARAVMKAGRDTPVVAIAVPDPVRSGLVKSLAHPGGQVTGISNLSDDLTPKRLALLKEAVPHATRIAVVRCPRCARDAGQSAAELGLMYEEQGTAARSLGMQLISLDLEDKSDFGAVAEALPRHKTDAVLINATPINSVLRAELLALTEAQRLPTMAPYRGFGAMLSYGPDFAAVMRLAADYVARILGGAKPGDLPMQQPTTFELVCSRRVAQEIGFTIPQSLLLRADEIIQ